jgi:hypothetical protein
VGRHLGMRRDLDMVMEEDQDLERVNLVDQDQDSEMGDLLILRSKIERFRLSEQVLTHRRRLERENNPLSIWPPSPKSPYRDEE